MTTLTGYTYNTVSSGSIYGGKFGPPAWANGVVSGQRVALPNSTLTSSGVGWSGTAPGGTGNYQTIITAWGGGILNTTGVYHGGAFIPGVFVVIFGGGHGDYAGNELYAYGPMHSDSPIWRRLTDPTLPAPTNVARDGNGKPVSRHTYDTLVYLPAQNKMLCIGAPGYYSVGFAFNSGDIFDFNVNPSSTNPWSSVDTGFPGFTGGGTISLMSGYDTVSNKAWGIGQGNATKLCSFDPATSTWSSYYKDNPSGPGNNKAALASSKGLFVFMNGTTVYAQDINSPNSVLYTPTVSGTAPATGSNALDWDSVGGYFVCLTDSGDMYKLTPGANPATDTWTWTNTTTNGVTMPSPSTNGVYGRFRVYTGDQSVPRGIFVMRRHDASIVFVKA